jgi:uncharacterized protein (TIGR00266 family)
MKHEILYRPSFAVARVMLDPGDSVRAESGAMVSMSPTVSLESSLHGGFKKVIGRLLGGESAFQSLFTATHGAGEVLLAPSSVGDITAVELGGAGYMVTSGSYLASDVDIDIETKANLRGFFAGEGLFMMRVSGNGTLLVSTFGALHAVQLMAGQPYVVDSGHIVAFSDTMTFETKRASRSLVGSITSGEGIVAHFTGPGVIYMQTRSPAGFASFIGSFLPDKS